MQNTFEISDLYTASYIYCAGEDFIGLKSQGNAYLFIFNDRNKCLFLVNKYLQNRGIVNAKAYSEAIKTLKNLIFSEKANVSNSLGLKNKNI